MCLMETLGRREAKAVASGDPGGLALQVPAAFGLAF